MEKGLILCIVVLVLSRNGSEAYKCFKPELLQNMTLSYRLVGDPFLTFDSEIMTCCKYCTLYSLCKAINFNRVSFQCQLMSETPNQFNTISDSDNILIDMENWREPFLGACKNHNCPNNTVCRELASSYQCEVIGCTGFPPVHNINSSTFEGKSLWRFNERVEYACKRGYYPTENLVCNADGEWSQFSCERFSKCRHVRQCYSPPEDKDYWFFIPLFQSLVKHYCKFGRGAQISLPYQNFASHSGFTRVGSNCSLHPINSSVNYDFSTTYFQKINIDSNTFQAYTMDYTFANSTFGNKIYGSAADCYPKHYNCGVLGQFVIDTRGTGLRFTDSVTWKTYGTDGKIENITRTIDGQVIKGLCGGNCGGCEIDESENLPALTVSHDDMPPLESAELPICSFLNEL